MGDDDVRRRGMENTARKAEVLKELEQDKLNLLEAIEKCKHTEFPAKYKLIVEKIRKISKFNLSWYLSCTKIICLAFSNNNPNCAQLKKEIDHSFLYILWHARLFGDRTQNMFQQDPSDGTRIIQILGVGELFPDSKFMRKISALISDLNTAYDRIKYNILNANVTYLTLLILRYHVQDRTPFYTSFHDVSTNEDYLKLCPDSFTELPKMGKHFFTQMDKVDLEQPIRLAVYAFLTIKDDLSKTILQETCLYYLKWHNMILPELFFKVIDLYGLDVGTLWDLISAEKTSNSLSRMPEYFTRNSEYGSLLPFTQVPGLESYQESSLSGNNNAYLCTVLAYIVDSKIGYSKSFIRTADWATDDAAMKAGRKIARAFYQFYDK